VRNDVVGAAEALEPRCEILRDIKNRRLGDRQKLVLPLEYYTVNSFPGLTYFTKVKDLQAVPWSFRANVDISINDLHVTPNAILCLGGESAQVLDLATLDDLHKGGSVGLSNGSKLTAIIRCPA
jgi:hypothetical protein